MTRAVSTTEDGNHSVTCYIPLFTISALATQYQYFLMGAAGVGNGLPSGTMTRVHKRVSSPPKLSCETSVVR